MSKVTHLVRLESEQLNAVYAAIETTIEVTKQGFPLLIKHGTAEEFTQAKQGLGLLMETSKIIEKYLIEAYQTEAETTLHPDYDPKREY